MILGEATGVRAPDTLLAALRYGVGMGAVVLGGKGTGWLGDRGGGDFKLLEEMNRSRINLSSSVSWGVEWKKYLTLDPFSMLTE